MILKSIVIHSEKMDLGSENNKYNDRGFFFFFFFKFGVVRTDISSLCNDQRMWKVA